MPEERAVPQLPPAAARFAEMLRMHMPELRQRHGVETLALFGSYVRGEQRPDSDLDVLVEFGRTPTLFEFIGLEQELSGLLGVGVELVMRQALRSPVGEYILKEATPV